MNCWLKGPNVLRTDNFTVFRTEVEAILRSLELPRTYETLRQEIMDDSQLSTRKTVYINTEFCLALPFGRRNKSTKKDYQLSTLAFVDEQGEALLHYTVDHVRGLTHDECSATQ